MILIPYSLATQAHAIYPLPRAVVKPRGIISDTRALDGYRISDII